jgi:hypothetical protein
MYSGRGLNVMANAYNLSEMYDDYINHIEKNSPYDITRSEYIKINSIYLQEMSNKILAGEQIKLNFRLGSFEILKFNRVKTLRSSPIDWLKTMSLGKRIYNLNEHSKGYRYNFRWSKKDCNVTGKESFIFTFSRYNRRNLAKLIKSGKVDYFEKIYYDN